MILFSIVLLDSCIYLLESLCSSLQPIFILSFLYFPLNLWVFQNYIFFINSSCYLLQLSSSIACLTSSLILWYIFMDFKCSPIYLFLPHRTFLGYWSGPFLIQFHRFILLCYLLEIIIVLTFTFITVDLRCNFWYDVKSCFILHAQPRPQYLVSVTQKHIYHLFVVPSFSQINHLCI